MSKLIIISTDAYNDLDGDKKVNFRAILEQFTEERNKVCFISRNADKLKKISDEFEENENIIFRLRYKLDEFISKNKSRVNEFIFIGNREVDFRTATNNKILYLVPKWVDEVEEKPLKYGIPIENINVFQEVVRTINNQSSWYYELELDDKSKVYSLTNANTKIGPITLEERELVNGFYDFLKNGKVTYYDILLYHFLASMANNNEFREVQDWVIIPSSSTDLNEDMMNFKEKVRYLMNGRVPKSISKGNNKNNMFLRHKSIGKSHYKSSQQRIREGSTPHFDSIVLNDAYKGKLKGRVVCVFDDYLTNGNTFEAIRNILRHEKVKKVIFVSLGRFKRDYYYQNYSISGDVCVPNGFKYSLNSHKFIKNGVYDDKARIEVENLHNIFNL